MKRLLSLTLSVLMIISAVFGTNAVVLADDTINCGDKGSNVVANYNEANHTLTLTGSGAMKDYTVSPWAGASVYNITDVIIGEGITHIGNSAFAGMLRLENVSIPNTVKTIGRNAFSGSMFLKSVNLPASVETIGAGAFRTNGVDFKGVFVDKNNKSFTDVNGMLFDKSKETLYLVPAAGSTIKLEIPNTIKTIVDKAAVNCVNLKEVVIPESVIALGDEVFTGEKSAVEKITILNPKLSLPEKLTMVTDTERLTIAGYDNSTAQRYAEALNIRFEVIGAQCRHNFGNGKVTKKATCKETGIKIYTCSLCAESYEETIAKTKHTEKSTITKATASNDGKIVKSCSVCNTVISTTIIPKATVSISKTSYTYTGKVQVPTVTVKNSQGNELVLGKDYKITYQNKSSIKAGSYNIRVDFIGDRYEGLKRVTYKINPLTNSIAKLNTNVFTTNGKVQKPTVTVKNVYGSKLTNGTHYTVTYSNANSKNVGRYTVTVKMKGNYSGTMTFPYYINPKPTEFVPSNKGGFKAISKGFTLKWNKQASQTTGYQIQYATKSDFSNAATITIANPNTTSYTIKGRAANTRYYVRVRTYKKIGTGTFYSSWNSGTKSVVTLK